MIEGGEAVDRDLGRAGEVVAIADPQATALAIIELLRNNERWEQAQAVGVERVHRYYSETLMIDRYRALYNAAMETV
ncbi:hypothetical protein D3C80_2131990 [compost metagenome]